MTNEKEFIGVQYYQELIQQAMKQNQLMQSLLIKSQEVNESLISAIGETKSLEHRMLAILEMLIVRSNGVCSNKC